MTGYASAKTGEYRDYQKQVMVYSISCVLIGLEVMVHVYLVNKPLQAAGLLEDNARD